MTKVTKPTPATKILGSAITPKTKLPTAPRALTPAQKRVWNETVKALFDLGILNTADYHLIEQYCILSELTTKLGKQSQKDPFSIRDYLSATNRLIAFQRHLGLTPYARKSIGMATKTTKAKQTKLSKYLPGS